MSKIHYFQRYSQRENVATNNTMLLFSRLYNESTYKFNNFINQLLDNEDIEIGVSFSQQEKSQNSIPDGIMYQSSFKIAIETKLYSGDFNKNQLENHLNSFNQEDKKILIALSPSKMDKTIFQDIEIKANKLNISFINITFKEIVDIFSQSINDVDIQLKEIIEDYEEYCIQERLITDTDSRIRIVPCGESLELNLKYGMHYMPVYRNTSEHGYFGVYNEKKVKGIGKISNMVVVEVSPVDQEFSINILESKSTVTDQQKERIIGIIKETREKIGWTLDNTPHLYTIVDKFYETNYVKKSKGGIMGHRYQNLKDVLEVSKLPNDEEIAHLLKQKEWE